MTCPLFLRTPRTWVKENLILCMCSIVFAVLTLRHGGHPLVPGLVVGSASLLLIVLGVNPGNLMGGVGPPFESPTIAGLKRFQNLC